MNIEELQSIANKYENDLREFRLSGDVKYLLCFAAAILDSAQPMEDGCRIQEFEQSLTENESRALAAIRETIGAEGNISIVKMIQKTGHSRPVFTSLLAKMEKYGVAEVKNQGVKGTNIKFLNKGVD